MDTDLAEAAHIQDVVLVQHVAVEIGIKGQSFAADALSE